MCVLAEAFPRQAVEEVIDAAAAREQRNRILPAWLTVYFVLALALFMDMGAGRVMRRLAGTLAWAAQGVSVPVPSEEALSNARTRLGPVPLRLLFEKTAGMLAAPGTAGAFWRGLHLVSVDGTTLDVQDTEANWERFGGPSTKDEAGRRLRGAFPQVRVVALAECGTRALIAAVCGAFTAGEKTPTAGLLPRLTAGMLVIADRNFAGYELWRDAAAACADLLWRAGVSFGLPVDRVLPDGTYLSRLKAPRHLRKAGARDITVRVIEYRLEDRAGEVTEAFTLITTLLDPAAAPARELADLYHARWQIETAIGAFKTQLKGAGIVLRSKTPDGAEQEVWALLCAYHAIRHLICAAAALTGQDPLRIPFTSALDVVRGPVGHPGAFPP
ncbi:MAG: IS4 family transposase [Streptosporangiaceae bacterium]